MPAVPSDAGAPLPRILVLGIGNLLWADEGFGVRCVEALHQRYECPSWVQLVDGGTQGLYLLELVCSSSHVLVFDAIDYGLEAGTLRVLRDAQVPAGSDTKMSLHQATFEELLVLARLRDRFPHRLTLVGVQPQVLDDLGGSLSPGVRARVDEAVELAAHELRAWGALLMPRAAPASEPLSAQPLALHAYEAGRPSAAAACRVGDSRFLHPATERREVR